MNTVIWESFQDAEPELRPFLRERARSPFEGFDWLRECWNRPGSSEKKQLMLTGVYADGRLRTFIPLWARRFFAGVREVGFVGEGLTPYPGLTGEIDEPALAAVVAAISRRYPHSFYRLTDIVEENPLRVLLETSPVFRARRKITLYPCPYRGVDDEGAVPRSRKKRMKRLRAYIRQLESIGDFRCEVLEFDHHRHEAAELLERLWALHTLRHHGTRNSWCRPENRDLIRNYVRDAETTGLVAFVSSLDGVPIAFDLGFRAGDAFVAYIIALHPAFAPFSAGHINQYLALERCREIGISFFDMSNGAGVAKQKWAHGSRDNCCHLLTADSSALSRFALACATAPVAAKAWGRRTGVNARIRRFIGPLLEPHASQAKLKANQAFQVQRVLDGEQSFSFSQVANLPLDKLIEVMQFVHDNGRREPPRFRRIANGLSFTGDRPGAELVVSLT